MKINPYKTRLIIAGVVGILSVLAFCGLFYPFNFLNAQFIPLLEKLIFDFSLTAVVLLCGIIFSTFLFGRFYCSVVCPLGILQEFFAFIRNKKKNASHSNYGFKYLIAGLAYGMLIAGSVLLIRYIDSYSVFASVFGFSVFGIIFLFIVLALVFFKNRFFCTNICPVGAVLGLVSKFSIYRIYRNENCIQCGICAKNCPSGCINNKEKLIDNEICLKCLKCLTVCSENAVKYGIKPVKFDIKRRDFLWGMGAFAMLGAGYLAGINFTKNIAKKIKNTILPAGAINSGRLINRCLNCNLCINNCPNGILVKADKEFPVVHIDYTKGKKYCKYDCNKCSNICPSGAIKKLSLEEKQNTKIAKANISDGCIECGKCVRVCPKGAIEYNKSKITIDERKCIGCGKCASVCVVSAINIFAAEEQSEV